MPHLLQISPPILPLLTGVASSLDLTRPADLPPPNLPT